MNVLMLTLSCVVLKILYLKLQWYVHRPCQTADSTAKGPNSTFSSNYNAISQQPVLAVQDFDLHLQDIRFEIRQD